MADHEFTPLAGEPGIVRAKGREYARIADAISSSMTALDQITQEIDTKSLAMTATRKLAGDVRDDISKALDRYRDTGDALVTYADALERAQSDADGAITNLARAQGDQAEAQRAIWRAEYAKDELPQDASSADVYSATARLNHAHARMSDANADIHAAQKAWRDARDDKNTAAAIAGDAIREVVTGSKVHDLKDSGWDRFKDFATGVYKVFKAICDVAAVLAPFLSWVPFLGQALVVLAAIGTIISLVEAIVKLVQNPSWATLGGLGLAALGMFGGKAIGALGKVAKAKLVLSAQAKILRTGTRFAPRVATARLGAATIQDSKNLLKPAGLKKLAGEVLHEPFAKEMPKWAKAIAERQGLKAVVKETFPKSPAKWLGIDDDVASAWKSATKFGVHGTAAAAALGAGSVLNAVKIGNSGYKVYADGRDALDKFGEGDILGGALSAGDAVNGLGQNDILGDVLDLGSAGNDFHTAADEHDVFQGGEVFSK